MHDEDEEKKDEQDTHYEVDGTAADAEDTANASQEEKTSEAESGSEESESEESEKDSEEDDDEEDDE